MSQFYVHPEDVDAVVGTARLDRDETHHAIKVMRCRAGQTIALFDAEGHRWIGVLGAVQEHRALVHSLAVAPANESELEVCLLQAVPKGPAWDLILQKGTELGVSCFQPLWSVRGLQPIAGERLERKLAQWRDRLLAACKQCERGLIPELKPPLTLPELSTALGPEKASENRLLLSTRRHGGAREEALQHPRHVTLAVGPEGGWEQEEELQLLACGFQPLKLGSRVLRTDSAAVVATAWAQWQWGDLVPLSSQ